MSTPFSSPGAPVPPGPARPSVSLALAFLVAGGMCLSGPAAIIEKGTPAIPPGVAAVAGTFVCHDGNAYRVVLTLNTDGTYWARGSSCLKNKGDASGVGTWTLDGRRIVLMPSREAGWMAREPKTFDVFQFKGDWIFVRADRPDYYNEHGVTDVSCFQRQAPEESYTLVADAELPRLRPFKATVECKQPCAAYVKAADGRRLCIGGPGATLEVQLFVQTLEEGRTYKLPKAFLDYRKQRAGKL